MRRFASFLPLVAAVLVAALFPSASTAAPKQVLTPIETRVIAAPNPVVGSDGRRHLVYEIAIANRSPMFVGIGSVRTVGGGRVVDTVAGERLGRLLRLNGVATGTTIPPGGSALLFMDVRLPLRAKVPSVLRHRFATTMHSPVEGPGGAVVAESGAGQPVVFTGAPTAVRRTRPVVLRPPLRGPRWLVAGGCCDGISSHRGATLTIDGRYFVAERFAIDFVQLDPAWRLFSGSVNELSSYAYFGAGVYSAAAGRVVSVRDDLPEQTPGVSPANPTIYTAGGNNVVVDIGRGRYALYAHLQPGSVRVRRGQRVRAGQLLGRLGNSGNSDAPHLHFHVMNGPSALASDGLPYVFSSFRGQGFSTTPEDDLFTGGAVSLDRGRLAGPHKRQLPLDKQIVSFPAGR